MRDFYSFFEAEMEALIARLVLAIPAHGATDVGRPVRPVVLRVAGDPLVDHRQIEIAVAVMTSAGTRMAGLELAREIAFRAIGGEHHRYWSEVQ